MINNRQIFTSHKGRLVPIKISNFSPYFNDTILENIKEIERPPERKKLIHSSYTSNRHSPQSQQNQTRTIHTSFQTRNQQQTHFNTMQVSQRYKEDLLPKVNQNINQLKQLMKQRVAVLNEMRKTNPNAYNFSQYKIKGTQQQKWNLSSLHSRKISQSPVSKSLKNKKRSIDNNEPKMNPQSWRVKQKSKKMILIGGSMPVRGILNPQSLPLNNYLKNFKMSKLSSIRKKKQNQAVQRYENDCKPWQIQESNNIYHLYER